MNPTDLELENPFETLSHILYLVSIELGRLPLPWLHKYVVEKDSNQLSTMEPLTLSW